MAVKKNFKDLGVSSPFDQRKYVVCEIALNPNDYPAKLLQLERVVRYYSVKRCKQPCEVISCAIVGVPAPIKEELERFIEDNGPAFPCLMNLNAGGCVGCVENASTKVIPDLVKRVAVLEEERRQLQAAVVQPAHFAPMLFQHQPPPWQPPYLWNQFPFVWQPPWRT